MIEHLVPAFYKSPSTASLSAQALSLRFNPLSGEECGKLWVSA